ncbi:MAG: TetR/AcrR family transcriptional regulator [Rikenellaceae bacterium]|nr:TetR/AcrR family transcriptional regulator [Rikenellaceae bacterium]
MTQREHIIERTSEMFVMHGIKSVRMDDIAQTLGVSKRTLYEMFGDKEELLYLCMSSFLEKQRMNVNEQVRSAASILESILHGFLNMMQYSDVNNRIMNNLQKFYPTVFQRIHKECGEVGRTNFRNAIHRCVEEGYLDEKFNMDLAITVLYYTAMGVVARRDFPYPDGVSPQKAFRHIVICFFRGVATTKGLAVIDKFVEENEMDI